ncbi:alpha/beta hydrolase family protein [Bacillus sp. FJAT-28004]|uniref:alpha/beta hydrolase family protein n=1 Tax=Bacillus sp. FJAT-28004 TaxID=1679165 RepID=UPI0006B63710|nr:MFS transporter [Bacillus sp. FJAT-28004]
MELVLQEPQLQQPPEPNRRKKTMAWLHGRFALRNERDHFVARVATGSTALFASLAMITAALGMPTGFGTTIDIFIFVILNIIAMSLAANLLSFLYNVLYLPIPRRLAAVWTYASIETYLILYFAELGILMSVVIALAFTLTGAGAGSLFGYLLKLKIKPWSKSILVLGAASAAAVGYVLADWPGTAATSQSADASLDTSSGIVNTINAPDPAEKGNFAFQAFTYGSGLDKHRVIFGDEVDVHSTAVDASDYITKWSKLKTKFWGFDEDELPLNGRVWMPEGLGPYPIALIVHGNHLMEDFSDGGYEYLGELLASQGIIAVSVDENFLNYSVWSGIPNNDMKVRAWVLLKHLQQIKELNQVEGNPFSGQVDLNRVALIGHSRGGQAVAMAADAERWFKDDKTLESLKDIVIESVVAIAPTDKQVDDKSARLSDVNYLTLQGARDADVNNFYGDRQYSRTKFQESSDKFKAALYIADANHSQFNSDWGRMDERPPGGLFLSRKELLAASEQRQISKVYVSAFLQATLLEEGSYKQLFEDYRSGLDWLPDTAYFNRYEASEFTEIARYDDGKQKTALKDGGKASVTGMTEWKIASAEDRDGKNKGTKGIELEWSEPGAEYALELSPKTSDEAAELSDGNLVFSMANLERDLIAAEDEDKGETANDALKVSEPPPLPVIEIELTTTDGESTELELDEIMPVAPPTYTAFMTIPWLEERIKDEKYKESSEPVFQTYTLPLELFSSEALSIKADEISRITFRFVNGPGKVMIDDIGFMS